MYTTLLNWATGFLGKSIAIAAFILGAGIGIALLADPGARRRRLRALHGLRADHHRLDHDRRDLTGVCRDRRVPRHPRRLNDPPRMFWWDIDVALLVLGPRWRAWSRASS